ncbi:MAG: extracellular solute-binding protein [Clostridia bacterium]|nr:extracellular solute-binding protein [Clostridia bacterium]
MKKRILSLAVLAALLLPALLSCHGSRESRAFELPERFDAEGRYEITFWAKNDTNKTQAEIYAKAIADFEALYPEIRVTLRSYTDYGQIYNDVITNLATGTTPHICVTYPDHIATYLTGENTVVPLDGLMADERYGLGGSEVRFSSPKKEEIVEKFLGECSFAGGTYALPFMRSTEACYINKTYVEKLGYTLPETLTWDFVWEVSEAAMKKDGEGNFLVNGQKVMIPFIYKSTDNMTITWLAQKDAPYSTSAGEIGIFSGETEAFLREVAEHAATGAFSTFKISSYPANFLNAGQCIFAVDSTAGSTWMGSDAPLVDIDRERIVPFETAVMTVPQLDPADPKMISQGPSLCLFGKEDPQEVLASWLFLQFLLTNDVQIAYSQTEGYLPVTEKALADPDYQNYLSRAGEDNALYYPVKIAAVRLLMENIDRTFVTPVFNGSASLRDAAGQLVENVVKSARRKETVDDAYFKKLYRDVSALKKLDRIGKPIGGDLGPLPKTSVLFLSLLGAVWAGLAAAFLIGKAREKRRKNKRSS